MREFEARLADRGIPVTVRDTRGSQIDGACGQLAAPPRAPDTLQISARVP
jgi:23S rRNA (adenine2503-C2)-methyltransferase